MGKLTNRKNKMIYKYDLIFADPLYQYQKYHGVTNKS